MKRKVLLIHGMPPKKFRFISVEETELMLFEFKNKFDIVEHNFYVNPSKNLQQFKFDLIIFTSTFLSKLSTRKGKKRIDKYYKFIRESKSLKVGLPQDDYWCQRIKDNWFSQNLNIIISVFSKNYWNELYPLSIKNGVKIYKGHTNYLSPKKIEKYKSLKKNNFEDKIWDIVYRTAGESFYPNEIGFLKCNIGEDFKRFSKIFKLNISNKEEDLLFGYKWLEFIASSKAILGSSSGSSVIIRDIKHSDEIIKAKKNEKPNPIHFEKKYFNKNDRGFFLTDISPRNIEAGLCFTLQILTEGEYGGILEPNKDYFPLKTDFSNISDLIELLKDKKKVNRITQNCYETLVNSKSLKVERIVSIIEKNLNLISTNNDQFYKKNLKDYLFLLSFQLKYYLKDFMKTMFKIKKHY